MIKQLFIIFFILGITSVSYSQDINVTVQAPQVVETGEQFQVDFIINGNPSGFIVPEMKDFQLLMGPSKGQSSNMTWINGKVSQSVMFTYSYVFQATKAGKYLIGAAEATVSDKKYKSAPFNIEVVGGNATAQKATQAQAQQGSAENVEASSDDLFLRVLVDKKNVYTGEYLTASIKLYTKVDISQLGGLNPSLNGFYVQQIDLPKQNWQKENVNGQTYHTAVFSKYILIPQKSGTLKIDALTIDAVVQKVVKSRSRGFFDDFFSDVREVQVKVKSLPVNIQVKPLPESNKPESFNGAVGKFTFDAKTDKNSVKANDAITLKISVSGNGNLKLIEAPKINFPPDFEVYDPKVSLNTTASSGHVSGSKTFEYLIIPRNPGKFTINPLTFSYFDVGLGQYKSFTTNEFNFDIEKGDNTQTGTVVTGLSKEDIKFVGKDILFIKTNASQFQKINSYFFGSAAYLAIYILGFLVFIGLIVMRRRIIQQNSNKALVRNRKADKFATRRLKQAKIHLSASEKEKFYEEILKGIWGYLGDKLNIPTSELSRDKANELLTKRNIEPEIIQQFFDLADNCEFARYAPSSTENALADDYEKAIRLITLLQQKLK